jgi:predicted nucleic acid-binding protein
VKRFALDSSALMAIYENRPGAAVVAALLQQATDGRAKLLMSVVNWGELYYSLWRTHGPGVARTVLEEVSQLPIDLLPAALGQTSLAAELKAQHNLPYVDCFAASLALQRRATLVTSDSDFSVLAKKLSLLWAR